MDYINLSQNFQKQFQTKEQPRHFFAPGRINLIGEHTDYNGGYVFPASISFGTYAAARKRNDSLFRLCSMNFPDAGIIEVNLSDLSYQEKDDWANYPKGMIHHFLKSGYPITNGADILYYGNIPNGAGLSSSASIELVTGVLLESLFDFQLNRIEMVKLGQQVENEYIGVNSGIMDQFAVGMGKKDHAILLDCNTLSYKYAPIELDNYVIIIINTNKQRKLADSKYNERRSECERALKDLQHQFSITSLGELTTAQFEEHKHLIKNEIDRKRARHAVYENERTKQAFEELSNKNLKRFGELMTESHLSLQRDYEVTGVELDTIAEAAWEQEGVLGARMTGAGFGGCAIAIVAKNKADAFQSQVREVYAAKTGLEADFYLAAIEDGAKEL